MTTPTYRVFDPLLPRAQATDMVRLCERFGTYGMYSQEASEASIGEGLRLRESACDFWEARYLRTLTGAVPAAAP